MAAELKLEAALKAAGFLRRKGIGFWEAMDAPVVEGE
jgi:hypothetical protein